MSINQGREARREQQRRPRLTFADADALREQIISPVQVGVESRTGSSIVGDNGRTASGVQVVGATPEIFEIRDLDITEGRVFTAQEDKSGSPVLVIGSETAEKVFEGLEPVGRSVRIRGFPYRVIGVLEERGSLFGESQDNLVIAPARSQIRSITAPRGYVDNIVIQALNPDELRDIQLQTEGIMRVRHRLRPTEAVSYTHLTLPTKA